MNKSHDDICLTSFYELPIDLCCVLDIATQKFVVANAAFESILGWPPQELIGKSIEEFITDNKTIIEKSLSKIKLGLEIIQFETQFSCKNKQSRWIAWRCHTDSKNKNIFAIGRDVTVYKETEKNLLEQGHVDHLTGIIDRKTLLMLLDKEVNNAVRYHYPSAILILDIDHFKSYNEQFGFTKADERLKLVAMTLKACLRRKTDILGRMGNDEFAVLLTHNDVQSALRVAEYLRTSLEKIELPKTNSQQPVTVSVGVAAMDANNTKKEITQNAMINTAYKALEISQQQGGNQINFLEI